MTVLAPTSAAALACVFVATSALADASLADADARLNTVYADAMARQSDDAGKEALRAAQRAWIAFRDAECGRAGDADACLLSQTTARADALEREAERALRYGVDAFLPSEPLRADDVACVEDGTQIEMTTCAYQDAYEAMAAMTEVEAEVTAMYAALAGDPVSVNPADTANPVAVFARSQRAWRAHVRAECGVRSVAHAGGSIAPMSVLGCVAFEFDRRAQSLRDNHLCGDVALECWSPPTDD